ITSSPVFNSPIRFGPSLVSTIKSPEKQAAPAPSARNAPSSPRFSPALILMSAASCGLILGKGTCPG
ncbi:hypothetical protein PENTCL1PPCAC_10263, partial [Pristionchus entomophagus]